MRFPNLPQALEAALRIQDDNWNESVLHVSDLSVPEEGCPRELWLRLKGADKRMASVGRMWRFRVAKEIHKDLTTLLKVGLPREWEIEGVEVPMSFDGIVGSADLLLRNTSNHSYIVVDYKSARGQSFHYQTYEFAKRSHEIQVQGYIYGLVFPIGAVVLYADREGDNGFRQTEPVNPDNETIQRLTEEIKAIRDNKKQPPLLEPFVEITENKGDNSVKLSMPWQCNYCDYRDVSCHGALHSNLRADGIVGYFDANNEFRNDKKTKGGIVKLSSDEVAEKVIELYNKGSYILKERKTDEIPF